MSISITINKNELFKFYDILKNTISNKVSEDIYFFNKDNFLICNNNKSQQLNILNTEDLLYLLKNELNTLINSKIKTETFTLLLSVSKLKNTSENVDYLYIILDSKTNNDIISLIDYKIYSYNLKDLTSDLFDFANLNNFNNSQRLFLQEYIEESKPDSIHLDNFIYIFEEALDNSLNIKQLAEFLELTIESAYKYDYSTEIHTILIEEDSILKLFKDKIKVVKCENGYSIYLGNHHLKDIKYKLSFV